jgi:hypothetical protein
MVFNGKPIDILNFSSEDDHTVSITKFLSILDGIIQSNFDKKCKNDIFGTKDVNTTISVFLYILLVVNLGLLGVFIFLFIKVKRRQNQQIITSSYSTNEQLLDNSDQFVD